MRHLLPFCLLFSCIFSARAEEGGQAVARARKAQADLAALTKQLQALRVEELWAQEPGSLPERRARLVQGVEAGRAALDRWRDTLRAANYAECIAESLLIAKRAPAKRAGFEMKGCFSYRQIELALQETATEARVAVAEEELAWPAARERWSKKERDRRRLLLGGAAAAAAAVGALIVLYRRRRARRP